MTFEDPTSGNNEKETALLAAMKEAAETFLKENTEDLSFAGQLFEPRTPAAEALVARITQVEGADMTHVHSVLGALLDRAEELGYTASFADEEESNKRLTMLAKN